jgi:hypothetical protein
MKVVHYYPAGSLNVPDPGNRFIDDWNMPRLRRAYRKLRLNMSAWDARCTISDLINIRTIMHEPVEEKLMPAGHEDWF